MIGVLGGAFDPPHNGHVALARSALDRFEIGAVVVLALATLATAWSGYEATRWGQESTLAQRDANTARIKAPAPLILPIRRR